MKIYDPMNHGDDDIPELENELRGLAMRQPPAGWKSFLLSVPVAPPPAPVPWLPRPFVILLAGCWTVTGAFIFITPARENTAPPVSHPAPPPEPPAFLLGYNTRLDLME